MTSFFSSTLFGQVAEATHTAPLPTLPTGTISNMSGAEARENALPPTGPVSVPRATVADADESTPDDAAADEPVPLIVSDILYPALEEPSVAGDKPPAEMSAPVADMASNYVTDQEKSKDEDATDDKGGDPSSVNEGGKGADKDTVDDKVGDKDGDKAGDMVDDNKSGKDSGEDSPEDSGDDSSIADYRASPVPEDTPVQSWPTNRLTKRKATGAPTGSGSESPAKKRGRLAKAAAKTGSGTPTAGKTAKKQPGRKPGRPAGRPPAAAARKSAAAAPSASSQPLSGRQAALAAKKLMEASVPKRAAAAAATAALGASAAAKRSRKPAGEPSKATGAQGVKKRGTKTAAATKTAATKTAAKAPKVKASSASAKGDADDTPEEYVVEAIEDTRMNARTKEREYRIKWAGYPKSQNTWEPRNNLTGCEALLRAFEKARRTTKKK